MKRIVLFLAGLLLLRRTPLRFLTRWSVRLGILAGLAYAAKRLLGPDSLPGVSRRAPVSPSGWTAPPTQTQTENLPAAEAAVASESGFAEIVIEDLPNEDHLREAVEESIAEARADAAESQTSNAPGEEAAAGQEPPSSPRWIRGDGSIDCPDDFPVKAKANSLIYHTVESSRYEITIPDVCFASREDAEAAGYRAPLR